MLDVPTTQNQRATEDSRKPGQLQVDWVLLVPKCIMSQEVDVLPSHGRDAH